MNYLFAIIWRSDSNAIISRPAKVDLMSLFTATASGSTLNVSQLPAIIPSTVFTQRIANPNTYGSLSQGFTTATTDVRQYMGAGTFSNMILWWHVAVRDPFTITLYKNGLATDLSLTFDPSTFADVFQTDTTHSVTVDAMDYVYYVMTGGVNVFDGQVSVEFTPTQ